MAYDALERLKNAFREFPGIGSRQAERFVYFLLHKDKNFRDELMKEIGELSKNVSQCNICFRFFEKKSHSGDVCAICAAPDRDKSLLMIVPKDVDFESVEASRAYRGLYFILGGMAAFSAKKQSPLRLADLKSRISSDTSLKEIIIATSLNPEGDNTRRTIEDAIREPVRSRHISVSTLGRGLSTGAEIEYIDRETLSDALSGRKIELLP